MNYVVYPDRLQGGPLPVKNENIAPKSRVVTPITQLTKAFIGAP